MFSVCIYLLQTNLNVCDNRLYTLIQFYCCMVYIYIYSKYPEHLTRLLSHNIHWCKYCNYNTIFVMFCLIIEYHTVYNYYYIVHDITYKMSLQ